MKTQPDYQPDYERAINVAAETLGSEAEGTRVVMALIKSGEMVCVPTRREVRGRKQYFHLVHENWALRDWMGVLIDEADALNYQQYLEYAKDLLTRLYGTDTHRQVLPDALILAADRLCRMVTETEHWNSSASGAVGEYRRLRGPE